MDNFINITVPVIGQRALMKKTVYVKTILIKNGAASLPQGTENCCTSFTVMLLNIFMNLLMGPILISGVKPCA